MIPQLKTGLQRCPFQFYTKAVNGVSNDVTLDGGVKVSEAHVREERTEFAECVGSKCMAYIAKIKKCAFLLEHMGELGNDSI